MLQYRNRTKFLKCFFTEDRKKKEVFERFLILAEVYSVDRELFKIAYCSFMFKLVD